MMGRQLRTFIHNYLLRPPVLIIGGFVRVLYWSLYGWWGEKWYLARAQEKLIKEIRADFAFLFEQHNARVTPNEDSQNDMLAGWPVVTISCEGLLLRCVHWRDTRQVHVASEQLPREWHDLSKFLNIVDADNSEKHSIMTFQDAAQILRTNFDLVKAAFSSDLYPQIKDQLEKEYRYAMASTRLVQNEINRRLYLDK